MNETAHFNRFRDKHRMAVREHIEHDLTSPSNGRDTATNMHDTLLPSGWRRIFHWETLIVSGRTVEKGFVVTPVIAGVLLAAFIGAVGWAYKSNTADQRQTLISLTRIETMLDERTKSFDKEQAKLESQLETEHSVAEMQREKQRDEMRNMKAAIQQRGIKIQ